MYHDLTCNFDMMPQVNHILSAIKRKKSMDTIILSLVASVCTFLIFIYWLSKWGCDFVLLVDACGEIAVYAVSLMLFPGLGLGHLLLAYGDIYIFLWIVRYTFFHLCSRTDCLLKLKFTQRPEYSFPSHVKVRVC